MKNALSREDQFETTEPSTLKASTKVTSMPLTVFSTDFNHLARSIVFTNEPNPVAPSQILGRINSQQVDIFEQLLLFDRLNFKVYGENAMLPLLIKLLGVQSFEALIEQEAFGFTLWTPMVGYMQSHIPGVDPLVCGTQSSPVHSDPEQSVEAGLKIMTKPLDRKTRRSLTKKLIKLYKVPRKDLSNEAVGFTRTAYKSGKLGKVGLEPFTRDLYDLPLEEKKILSNYAEHLLEYRYLLEHEMTSFSSYDFYTFFRDTAEKINSANTVKDNFSELATIEEIPDFRALITQISDPYQALPKLRDRRNARKFREWIAKASVYENHSIKENYHAALEEGLGFFQTKKGRFVKTLAVTSMGLAIGHKVDGFGEALLGGVGAVVTPFLEPATGVIWDQIDEFLFNGMTKGWTPRMFFNDIKLLRKPQL